MGYDFQLCEKFDPSRVTGPAIVQPKLDGTMALSDHGAVINRRRAHIGHYFPEIPWPKDAVLVGEVCVFRNGVASFESILRRQTDNPAKISLLSRAMPATFVAFDILEVNGEVVMGKTLEERLIYLRHLLGPQLGADIRYPDRLRSPKSWDYQELEQVLKVAEAESWEGVIVKLLDRPYRADRNDSWMKLKMWKEAWFPIERWEITEKHGFNVIIVNKGREQEVVCNDQQLQPLIASGAVTEAEVQYLKEYESHALRQPSLKSVR